MDPPWPRRPRRRSAPPGARTATTKEPVTQRLLPPLEHRRLGPSSRAPPRPPVGRGRRTWEPAARAVTAPPSARAPPARPELSSTIAVVSGKGRRRQEPVPPPPSTRALLTRPSSVAGGARRCQRGPSSIAGRGPAPRAGPSSAGRRGARAKAFAERWPLGIDAEQGA
ncbi:hypothetical protein PVAP13_8NG223501 [Panicum virgatum]|uniref:Uncharacterized protein n=1 Tax=Panicum virgatum TaxID=38727 RepID=A0A8T0P6E1_PANVG|nr:hypothetical protein PVAP13_8NG223501 [Panicum virgatum]